MSNSSLETNFTVLLSEPTVVLQILRFSSRSVLLSCSLANRLLYRLSSDDELWRPIVRGQFNEYADFVPSPPDGPDDFPAWKKRFIRKSQSEKETAGQVAVLTNQDTDVWRCSKCQGVIFVAACGLPMEIIPCEGCGTYIGGVDHKIWPGTEFLGSLKDLLPEEDTDATPKTMPELREFLRTVPVIDLSEHRADPAPRWIDPVYERERMSGWTEYDWTRKARFYLRKAIASLSDEDESAVPAVVVPVVNEYPKRAILQEYDGKLDAMSRIVAAELGARSIPVVPYNAEQMRLGLFGGIGGRSIELTDTDLVVGDWECTRAAMTKLNISFPKPPDYPECLKHLLHRRIWETTLREAPTDVFIKPSIHAKKFSGLISSTEWISTLQEFMGVPGSEPIYCSEVVKFVSEYRTYVVKGKICATCHYATISGDEQIPIDEEVVTEAVRILEESEELKQVGSDLKCLAGYGIDFGVIKMTKDDGDECFVTALIEVNDGISLGHYEGLSWGDYTELLVARWEQLLKSRT